MRIAHLIGTAILVAATSSAYAQQPAATEPPAAATVAKPEALVADGIPPVPMAMIDATRPYMESRSAGFSGWNPLDRSMLVSTRFGNTNQLHSVKAPMMARSQISFEAEPLGGSWSPKGDVLLAIKDTGGNEFYQLYTLKDGRLTLLTDGKSRNGFNGWSPDGSIIAYSSTKRNGTDNDLYIMDPRDPKSARMVAEVKGGGWGINAIAHDNKRALVTQYVSVQKSNLFLLDLASGKMTPVGDHAKTISYGGADFAPDGTLWITSDEDSDFQRLGTLDLASGKFTPRTPEKKWDVDGFDLSDDGKTLVYAVNEAGTDIIKLMDVASGNVRTVTGIPKGTAGGMQIAPWGTIGLSFNSAKGATDAYSIDPATLAVTRWTQSETGGLDPNINVEPTILEVKSFDGEPVSGLLYKPDPKKFPGKRPLIISVHGGPEGQSTAGFRGRNNYYLNELGVALFYPNVRGSTGFGKRFVSLDNGPFKREDSVKDIGAFLDALNKDSAIDPKKTAITGGSYGGYMCYASAIRYGDRLKAANCVVAISNFVTFLENTQSYRRDLRRVDYGDERDPAQKAKLIDISPMTNVAKLKLPLMVVTGGNDPRVPASEADQIVKAVRGQGGSAWHLLAKNEGHGFAKKENSDYQFWVDLMFWQKNLLGDSAGK